VVEDVKGDIYHAWVSVQRRKFQTTIFCSSRDFLVAKKSGSEVAGRATGRKARDREQELGRHDLEPT
jgi:hypothetical protein